LATAPVPTQEIRPDQLTLAAFASVVLIGGANFVAVRFSNQELPPFFGAGIRFALAALLFLAVVAFRRIPLPRGRALFGTVLYGLLAFTAAYALAYWALVELPAGIAGVVMSSVPLLTFFFALLHGVESFQWRGLVGGIIAIAGIGVLLNAPLTINIPLGSLLAMVGAAACAAESGVLIKKFPPSHPIATNGVAMAIGTVLLLILSAVTRETWSVPNRQRTWFAFAYLVVLGSVGLFALFLYVLKRWTASGASYQFVLMPIIAVLLGALLAGEPISAGVVLGGAIVLAGVYVGALSRRKAPAPAPPEKEALAQRCTSC
jgi:drug/metabolite transporter (DMT)-like permease